MTMDFETAFDMVSKVASDARSKYHLTLGQLVEELEKATLSNPVVFDFDEMSPGAPDSYRGYYEDLSFAPSTSPITVRSFLVDAKDAIGAYFEGYKGGDFKMHSGTALWASGYGSASGRAIIGVKREDDRVVLITKLID